MEDFKKRTYGKNRMTLIKKRFGNMGGHCQSFKTLIQIFYRLVINITKKKYKLVI